MKCQTGPPLCKNNHPTMVTTYAAGSYRSGWVCDICSELSKGRRWHCETCAVDYCLVCLPRRGVDGFVSIGVEGRKRQQRWQESQRRKSSSRPATRQSTKTSNRSQGVLPPLTNTVKHKADITAIKRKLFRMQISAQPTTVAASDGTMSETTTATKDVADSVHVQNHQVAVSSAISKPAASFTESTSNNDLMGTPVAVRETREIIKHLRNEVSTSWSLPSKQDLAFFPVHCRNVFADIARETIQQRLLPRLALAVRRRRKRNFISSNSPISPTPLQLRSSSALKNWPEHLLIELISKLKRRIFLPKEHIFYPEERVLTGMFIAVRGCTIVVKPISKGDQKGEFHPEFEGKFRRYSILEEHNHSNRNITVFGDLAYFTKEAGVSGVRAETIVDGWSLCLNDYKELVENLPTEVYREAVFTAFENRNAKMSMVFPMTEQQLAESSTLFSALSPFIRSQYVKLLRPLAIPPSFTLVTAEEQCSRLFFLRNGVVIKKVPSEGDLDIQITAPACIGDVETFYKFPYGCTATSLTTCDFWVLDIDCFQKYLWQSSNQAIDQMRLSAVSKLEEALSLTKQLYTNMLNGLPPLQGKMTNSMAQELILHSRAKVHGPNSVVCSTSGMSNKLIIICRGRVKVEDHITGASAILGRGDILGLTCMVPHRWARSAVSMCLLRTLEIPCQHYSSLLRKYKLIGHVLHWSKCVLFPNAFPQAQAFGAQRLLPYNSFICPLYPVSELDHINLGSAGFVEVQALK